MKVENGNALLRMLDSNLAAVLSVVIEFAHEDGTWISTEAQNRIMQKAASISRPTVFRYVRKLVDKRILLSSGKGMYRLNPDMIEMMK